MTEQMPKGILERTRAVATACSSNDWTQYPKWWIETCGKNASNSHLAWANLLFEIANELEQMQQLNGRLLRRLAGD